VSVHKQVSGTTSLNLTKYHVHVTYGHGSVLCDTLCTGTLGFMNDVTTFVDRLYSLCMVLVVFLVTTTAGDKSIIIIIVIIIIINEYYYSVVVSKKLQEHLTTEKNKTNDSVTQVKNSSQTVRDQTSSRSAVSSAVA